MRQHSTKPLQVLFENNTWLVINKPAGISVHSGAGDTGPSIVERLKKQTGKQVYLAHRLDRETSGVLALSWSAQGAQLATKHWSEVHKKYLAMVVGTPKKGVVNQPLKTKDGRTQSAETHIENIQELTIIPELQISLVEVKIITGRNHQIRKHLAHLGHPVLMDDKYGKFSDNKIFSKSIRDLGESKPKHLMLHCHSLKFPKSMGIPKTTAPQPTSWTSIVKRSIDAKV